MQIKQQALAQQVQKYIAPLYVLTGQEPYLLDESLNTIKAVVKKSDDCDEKIISINSSDDWNLLLEEANSYSLFYDKLLLNIFYDKKSIDAAGKKVLTEYLKTVNSKCIIIIRAPNIPTKQLLWLVNNDQAVIAVAYPLTNEAMKQWISNQLIKENLTYVPQIPELIQQYTEGNMLACAQVIEKLILSNPEKKQIETTDALEQLSDQCTQSPFALVEACLLGQSAKAIHILRQAAENKTEATLILWILTQEIRLLLQLSFNIQNNIDFKTICAQLKIWPQRTNCYQLALKRLDKPILQRLLTYSATIDEQIKSNISTQAWNALEKLALSLSLGSSLVTYA